MCREIMGEQGISVWCDFCPFVSDNEEEAMFHQRDNPDHITHRVEFSYSINNRPKQSSTPQASKTIFICITHELILKDRESREKHALTPLCHVVMISASYELGEAAMRLSESERERLK